MCLEAARLVRLVAANVAGQERNFDILSEHIEQEQRLAVFVERLFCGFAVDGGDERVVVFHQQGVEKIVEGILEFFERHFRQYSGDRGIVGWLFPLETEWLLQNVPVGVCPSLEVSDVGQSCEQSDEDEDERAVVVVSDSAWLAGIVGLFEDVGQGIEGRIVHEKPPCGLK